MTITHAVHSFKPFHMKSEWTAPAGFDSHIRDKYTRYTQAVINNLSFYKTFPPLCCFELTSSHETFPILFFATHARVTRHWTHRILWHFFFVLQIHSYIILSKYCRSSNTSLLFFRAVSSDAVVVICDVSFPDPRYRQYMILRSTTYRSNTYSFIRRHIRRLRYAGHAPDCIISLIISRICHVT